MENKHFVADFANNLDEVDAVTIHSSAKSVSAFSKTIYSLVHNPLFIVSSLILFLLLIIAVFPGLFTQIDPTRCVIREASLPIGTNGEYTKSFHLLGTTGLGCDEFARIIYGARTSLLVGFFVMVISTSIGCVLGAIAGYFGGILDSIISRITDVFFAIPLILGAVALLQLLKDADPFWKVVLTLSIFGWTSSARLMRSSVMETKTQEYVTSVRALGMEKLTILFKHVIPNAISPIIAIAMISMSVYIVADSALSFLGVGMNSSVVSWGVDIANAQTTLQSNPGLLLYPSIALAITALSFMFLGDSINDAIDPKKRRR
ncbi:MAG: ABC transporter permease [Candidatus Ancillula sp.]|jgi:oligopeptide transport system permease protein|nr:ABC transporter permease [Candidatus Ancillula sp.]